MELFAKLFLKQDKEYIFGPGRLELLHEVEQLGSLRQAAQKTGMSYRWAWGRIKDTERFLGVTLLTDNPEPGKRTKVLSQDALELLAWYRATEASLNRVLHEAMHNSPPCLNSPRQCFSADKKAKKK